MRPQGKGASLRPMLSRGPSLPALLAFAGVLNFLLLAGWMFATWGSSVSPPKPHPDSPPAPAVPAVALPSEQKPVRLFTGADPFGAGSFIPAEESTGMGAPSARLTLEDVRGHENEERAVLRSGGRRYIALEGERFAGSFVLVDAWGPCATLFHLGRLTLCEGDSISR
jgi:hypothetical protein